MIKFSEPGTLASINSLMIFKFDWHPLLHTTHACKNFGQHTDIKHCKATRHQRRRKRFPEPRVLKNFPSLKYSGESRSGHDVHKLELCNNLIFYAQLWHQEKNTGTIHVVVRFATEYNLSPSNIAREYECHPVSPGGTRTAHLGKHT